MNKKDQAKGQLLVHITDFNNDWNHSMLELASRERTLYSDASSGFEERDSGFRDNDSRRTSDGHRP
ncbi:MAG TPA: hypothetical protein VIK53_14145 [Verrucomicrobiae bacterium]